MKQTLDHQHTGLRRYSVAVVQTVELIEKPAKESLSSGFEHITSSATRRTGDGCCPAAIVLCLDGDIVRSHNDEETKTRRGRREMCN